MRCSDCRFFREGNRGESWAENDECRRRSPAMPPAASYVKQADVPYSAWPRVMPHDWCGEFERKP